MIKRFSPLADLLASKLTTAPLPSWGYNFYGASGSYIPSTYHVSADRAYEHSLIVAQAINKIKSTVGMALPVVKRLDRQTRTYVEVDPTDPLRNLINRPAPKLTRAEFFQEIVARHELEGNAFIHLSGRRVPETMRVLPTSYMRIVVNDDTGEVREYIYEPTGKSVVHLSPDEIIHIKRWHPNNAFWGLSRLSAAMIEVDSDDKMARWNQNFFGPRNAVPNMAVEIQGQQSDQEFEKMRREWYERGGLARETVFFRTGAGFNRTVIHPVGLTPIELAFLESRKFNRKAILDLFGVPESMFDKDVTEASSITGERNYYQNIYEWLTLLGQALTIELAPFFEPVSQRGSLQIDFKDIRPIDRELRLREIEVAEKSHSINEIRQQYYDLPPIEWGDGPAAGAASTYIYSPIPSQNGPIQQAQAAQAELEPQDNPQLRGLEKAVVVKLQKAALAMWRKGQWRPDLLDLSALPPFYRGYLQATLPMIEEHDQILRLFDPLFAVPLLGDGKAVEEDTAEYVTAQILKLDDERQGLVIEIASELVDAFGLQSRLAELREAGNV